MRSPHQASSVSPRQCLGLGGEIAGGYFARIFQMYGRGIVTSHHRFTLHDVALARRRSERPATHFDMTVGEIMLPERCTAPSTIEADKRRCKYASAFRRVSFHRL